MAKKSTPVKKAKAPVRAKAPAKSKVPAKTGMWKILEQKQAHLKNKEQARAEGLHSQHGAGHEFHANPRDARYVKFAGPRRKAG